MSPTTASLLKPFETLPPHRQQQVLDFIEFLVMRSHVPSPQIIAQEPQQTRKPRQLGSAIGTLTIVSDDEEHLEAFSEYMP